MADLKTRILARLAMPDDAGRLGGTQAERMARAAEQGYDTSRVFYHGTGADVTEFDPLKMGKTDDGWFSKGFYFSPDAKVANQYAADGTPNVLPVYLRAQNPYDWRQEVGQGMRFGTMEERYAKTREIMDKGYDSVDVYDEIVQLGEGEKLSDDVWQAIVARSLEMGNPVLPRDLVENGLRQGMTSKGDFARYYGDDLANKMPLTRTLRERVVFGPAQVRSVNADFNPANRHKPDLLGAATPGVLAGTAALTGGGMMLGSQADVEGMRAGIDTVGGLLADTGQMLYAGGKAAWDGVTGGDASEGFTGALSDRWMPPSTGGRQLIEDTASGALDAYLGIVPPLLNPGKQTIGQQVGGALSAAGDWWGGTAAPWLDSTIGERGRQAVEGLGIGAGSVAAAGVLPGRLQRYVPEPALTLAGYVETPRLLGPNPDGKQAELLRKPAVRAREQMRAGGETVREIDPLPEVQLRPEDLLRENAVLVPHQGDQTIGGGRVHQVGGVPLTRSIELEGGPDYSRLNRDRGVAWASNLGPAAGLQANINLAAEMTGKNPFGLYTTMGPYASNFSTHIADLALAQLDHLPLSKRAKAAFDGRMNQLVGPLANVEQFVGLDSQELRDQLMGLGGHSQAGAGKLRTIFTQEMAQARHRNEGFPVLSEAYDAANNPRLAGAGPGFGGYSLFRGRPGAELVPGSPHSSYTHDVAGEYAGGLADQVPLPVLTPRLWEQSGQARDRSGRPLTVPQRINQIQVGHTYEPIDQQWVDSVSQWLEQHGLLR